LLAALVACDAGSPPPAPSVKADGTLDLIFFNQLEGFAEGVPCVEGSLSPLASAAELRDRLRAEGRDAVVLVAIGNSLFRKTDPRPAKAYNTALLGRGNAILAAFAAAELDVWVPGPVEMALDAEHVLERCAELELPLLISNRRFKQEEELAEDILPWYVVQAGSLRVGLLGMIGQPPEPDPDLIEQNPDRKGRRSRLEVRSAVEAANRLSARLRNEQGVHVVIVMSALGRGVNLRLAQAEGVDMVIGSTGERFPAGRVIIEGKAATLSAEMQGREVGHVTLTVRDGDMQFIDLSPLYSLPLEAEPLKRELEALVARYGTADMATLAALATPDNTEEFLLRYRKIEDADTFVARYTDYTGSALFHRPAELTAPSPDNAVLEALEAQGSAIDEMLATTRLRPSIELEGRQAIPAVDSCRACHDQQVRFWEGTAHAGAYETLRERGRAHDPACLRCHAAGFADVTGWLDPRLDAPLGPVTCFSCHRLTSAHPDNRIQVLNPAHYVSEARYMPCAGCHDELRSPHFDREAALASVTCPPMRTDEPALVFARERALDAIEARQAGGVFDPQDDYLSGLGLLGLGRSEEGARHLLTAAETNRSDVRQAVESARALDQAGLSTEGIVILRTYLDGQIGDPTVNLEHVRMLLEANDPSVRDPREALAVIDLMLPSLNEEIETDHIRFRLLQVDAFEALGRQEDAERLLRRLAGRFHDNEDVVSRLERTPLAPR
jgi:hypothetical protein